MSSPVTVWRRLDAKKLSSESLGHFIRNEGVAEGDFEPLVEDGRARSAEVSSELIEATKEFVLLGLDGEILATYKDLSTALRVAATARVVFDIELEPEEK